MSGGEGGMIRVVDGHKRVVDRYKRVVDRHKRVLYRQTCVICSITIVYILLRNINLPVCSSEINRGKNDLDTHQISPGK